MVPWEGFILGVSNGAACIATCAPVLIPCLMGEGKGIPGSIRITCEFLLGRLAGYLFFAVLAWIVGRMLLPETPWHNLLIGSAYAVFSVLLVHYGFLKNDAAAPAECGNARRLFFLRSETASLPVVAGLVTGLAFCPPFLLAFTGAAQQPSLPGSILFFLAFFAGTSLLFIPAPLVGAFRRFGALKTVGRLAAGVMGLYFLYSGFILILGGIHKL